MSRKRRWRLTRRGLLIGAGTLGVLALGANYLLGRGRMAVADVFNNSEGGFGNAPNTPSLWLELSRDNQIMVFVPKAEMGQGIHTALAQIAAEELEADWATVKAKPANTAHGFSGSAMMTGGSNSVSSLYQPIREAAANMREMLRTEAATQLGVAPTEVVLMESRAYARSNPQKVLSYGQVVAAKQGDWVVPEPAATLKSERNFTLVGQPLPRVDLQSKITGQAVYGYDARVEGMVYGAVARPPRYGAKPQSVSATSIAQAESLSGVKVVVDLAKGFVGAVAPNRSLARRTVDNLQIVWEGGTDWGQTQLEEAVRFPERGGIAYAQKGNTRALANPTLQAEYWMPMAAHAHLEPQAALVQVKPNQIEAWVSTQMPQLVQQGIARATGRKESEVLVHPTYLGGGFGRKMGLDVAFEAAMLSQATGQAVHVGWSRTEELRYGYFRPPSRNTLRATLGPDGRVAALEHRIAGGDVFLGIGLFPELVGTLLGYDPGALSGAMPPYSFAGFAGKVHRVKLPVPTGWWRSLGSVPNVFALESFMDELATQAKTDPLEFRLQHLGDSPSELRMKAVLQKAAQQSGWGQELPQGQARGIACGKYGQTMVAMVAQVSLEGGEIRVAKITAAIDCGLVINPSGAEAQAQGSIVMGLSTALLEQITIKNGMAEADNFGGYPLLTLRQTPQIDVVFVSSGNKPHGMGEPVVSPVAPAVANALFALTGQRQRRLPLQASAT